MTDSHNIDAAELISVRARQDGRGLHLRFRDRAGRTFTVALPSGWLNEMLTALPCPLRGGEAVPLASWSVERGGGDALILTLRSPEGQVFTFAVQTWQIAGMATIATYGGHDRSRKPPLH